MNLKVMNIKKYLIVICYLLIIGQAYANDPHHQTEYETIKATKCDIINKKIIDKNIDMRLDKIGIIMDQLGSLLIMLVLAMYKINMSQIYILIIACCGFLLIIVGTLFYLI